MLVYGPSAQGALRELADQLGGQTLSDLPKPVHLGWAEFSIQTLDMAAASGLLVIFDLTHLRDTSNILQGKGQYAQTITGIELRYIHDQWNRFRSIVQFFENGGKCAEPWQQP
jgi:hypothetical protein